MKGKVGGVGVRMYTKGRKWVLNSILFAEMNCEERKGRIKERGKRLR